MAPLRDTFDGCGEYPAAYPDEPMTSRVPALLAARRATVTRSRSNTIGLLPLAARYPRRGPPNPIKLPDSPNLALPFHQSRAIATEPRRGSLFTVF
jgi:hypothetical protein